MQNEMTVTGKLVARLKKAMPMVIDTGLARHLRAIKEDSRNRRVFFSWEKRDFVINERAVVREVDFTTKLVDTDLSNQLTKIIKGGKIRMK